MSHWIAQKLGQDSIDWISMKRRTKRNLEFAGIYAILGLSIIGFIAFLIFVFGGGGSTEIVEAPKDFGATSPIFKVQELKERLVRATETCEHGAGRFDPDGKIALAEADLAMAASIDDVSPAQEQRIRESIGSEMGIPPSQVNGWKDIYRGRAEQARRLIAEAERREQEVKEGACANLPVLRSELAEAERQLKSDQ